MNQVTTGFAEVNGGKLYYEMVGSGETLVLGHAGFVDSRMWDEQWGAFAQHYRVIRYDMRGFGKSDPATEPISRREEFYQLLNQLQIEPAHLLGYSMSGEMMLDFALEHPDRVASLTVVSAVPGGFEMQGAPPPHLMEMFGALQQGDLKLASELQIRIWVDGIYRQPEQVNPLVRQRAAEMNHIAVANSTMLVADSQPLRPLTPSAVGRLSELDVPALIVAGALDHPEILRAAEVLATRIKGAQKVIIADSAHVPNMEQPAAFNEVILSFLAARS